MRIKSLALDLARVKAGPEDGLEEGEFIVYPSTFTRTPDAYGDVVAKGAFAEGIAARKESGAVLPGLFGHRMDDPDFWVAYATEEAEDDHGWRVRGRFDLDEPKAAKVYRLVKGRRLRELSFAYEVHEEGAVELEDGTKANELRKLEAFEFSFVPIGANRDTSVVAVKAAVDALVDGFKAGRVLSAKNEQALREAVGALAPIVDSLKGVLAQLEPGESQGKASDGASTNEEEPGTANSEESARPSSAHLLGHLSVIDAL